MSPEATSAPAAPQLRFRLQLFAAFAVLYTWGTTFLFIRYAVETIPPFIVAGTRVLVAGAVLYVWARLRGAPRPTRTQWGAALIIGALMLGGGEGGVNWALQRVPSGLGSVLFATVPLWMVVMDWLLFDGQRPSPAVVAGLVLGLLGIVLLVGPGQLTPAGEGLVNPLGAAVLILAALSFSFGSLHSRRVPAPDSPLLAAAMWMLSGGVLLWALGALTGQAARLDPGAVSTRSALSLAYLIVYGSLMGYTAYFWLLRVSTPTRVASYAYVQPVVAMFLGWAVGGESLNPRMFAASAVVVASVVLIITQQATDS
jgi:drug/metabolite transporter (DMT)-like permease